jgi:hypothetical protein
MAPPVRSGVARQQPPTTDRGQMLDTYEYVGEQKDRNSLFTGKSSVSTIHQFNDDFSLILPPPSKLFAKSRNSWNNGRLGTDSNTRTA